MIWRFPRPQPPASHVPGHGAPTMLAEVGVDRVEAETYPEAVAAIVERWRREGVVNAG